MILFTLKVYFVTIFSIFNNKQYPNISLIFGAIAIAIPTWEWEWEQYNNNKNTLSSGQTGAQQKKEEKPMVV